MVPVSELKKNILQIEVFKPGQKLSSITSDLKNKTKWICRDKGRGINS